MGMLRGLNTRCGLLIDMMQWAEGERGSLAGAMHSLHDGVEA